MTRRWGSLVLGALLVGVVATLAGFVARSADGPLERLAIDARIDVGGTAAPRDDLVIVAVDNETLRHVGERPPFSRTHYADVVRRLDRAGASVIALDVAFPGITFPDEDEALVAALRAADRAVVSVSEVDRRGGVEPLAGIVPFRVTGVAPGYTGLPTDPGATVRRFSAPIGPLDSFATAVAGAWVGGPRIVPPDDAFIVYPGAAGTVPMISMADVLDGRVPPARLRGRIVVVGPTAPVLGDLHRVPVHGTMSGPEIQAAAIDTALDGFPLRSVSETTTAAVIVVLGFLLPLLLLGAAGWQQRRRADIPSLGPVPPPVRAVIAAGGLLALAWTVVAQLAFGAGHVVELVPGLVTALTATALAAGGTGIVRRRYQDRVRDRLAEEVPDEAFVDRVLAADPDELLGSAAVFDGYRLTGKLKVGGMGRVYRAVQEDLDREVALKLIHRQYSDDPRHRERFLAEARHAARVEHPNVVPIFAVGEHRGLLYIAMQWIRGQDLEETLHTADRLQPAFAARLTSRVAGALDAAARSGLVHRDVKPANIILPDEDVEHPYLTDFGIARASGAASGEQWAGTKEYASPEQIEGAALDGRSDVYSLAAVLFRCLTGAVPYSGGDHEEMLRAHREAPQPRVTALSSELPTEIDAVIGRALAIDPEERYPTATEFARAALAVLGDEVAEPARKRPRFSEAEQTERL
ncbi:MAG: CHASE2 domain-containing serine/threonine-protein kinase [Solirubrobacteraceae bacterium]